MTDSSSSHDTTQDSRDSLEGTNTSEGDQVQPSHDSNLSSGPTSDKSKGGMTLEELSILCTNLSNRVLALEASKDAQAAEIIKLKARIKKLKKKSHPVISHHKAWLRSVSRLSMKRKLGRKESVSKQGRKNAKPGPTLDDSTFDDLDADHGMDYMDTEEPVNEGRLSKETEELNVTHDTEVLEKGGSNKEPVSAAGNTGVSTAVPEVSTATPMTPPTTTSVFEDEDIFLADALVMLSDKTKLKGVMISEELLLDSQMKKERCISLKEKDQGPYNQEIRKGRREKLQDFSATIGSEKDKRMIEKMNKKAAGVDKEEVFRADRSLRYIKTFTEMVSRFDRLDFIELHSLVMKRFETSTPEGIDLILWGIHILVLEDGTEFYMLAERRLIVESESEAVFDLLRFIQKQIDESKGHDGSEKDL
ncbi:hypothetical protein Tco_0797577 [Tanacetum coccineum]